MEIAFFLVSRGDSFYLKAAEKMIGSIRDKMPGATITMLSDNSIPQLPVDKTVKYNGLIDSEELMFYKGAMWAEYARQASGNLVLTDVDVIFRKDVSGVFRDYLFDVGVFFRKEMPSQPYLGGHVYSTERARSFWEQYARILANLPRDMRYWWCDQIALNLLIGATPFETRDVFGARVQSFPVAKYIHSPERADDDKDSYAYHYKGTRKAYML